MSEQITETPPRAVIVDDNLMFAMMIEPGLKQQGYAARTVAGSEAMAAQLASEPPSLLLVNLTSTRYPGAEFILTYRSAEQAAGAPPTPVIGYAGHVEQAFLHAGREAGATMVVPNSAIRAALPEVLRKLQRVQAGEPEE